jgi:hypothetical protein
MFAAVPFGTSAFGSPATVTLPGFVECSNCKWLPR